MNDDKTDRRELLRRWVEGLWRTKVRIVERVPFPYTIDLQDLRKSPERKENAR